MCNQSQTTYEKEKTINPAQASIQKVLIVIWSFFQGQKLGATFRVQESVPSSSLQKIVHSFTENLNVKEPTFLTSLLL